MEGDFVTLHTDVTELQTVDLILWFFLRKNILLAQFNRLTNNTSFYDGINGRFRDRLILHPQTGSLTITNVTAEHTGLYQVEMINSQKPSYKRFNLTVHFHLRIPVIDSPQCNSSKSPKCSMLCSVLNVAHVSLSWYNGSSLLSSISVSDLNIRLSLPLEVDYEDTNTYTCVLNNISSKQIKVVNVAEVCQPCSSISERHLISVYIELISVLLICVLLLLLAVIGFVIYNRCRNQRRMGQRGQAAEENHVLLNNGVFGEETDSVKTVQVQRGDSITLNADATEIQIVEQIVWRFGVFFSSTNPFIPIATLKRRENRISFGSRNDERFRDRLKLDNQSGSLTIYNIMTEHAGIYKVQMIREGKKFTKTFCVIVYGTYTEDRV